MRPTLDYLIDVPLDALIVTLSRGENTKPQLCEAIEAGLRAYEGAMLVVSHDEYFARAIGVTQEYVLEHGQLVRR